VAQPALLDVDFVAGHEKSVEAFGALLAGDQKRYKDLPSPMPPNSMSDARLAGIIAYLKNEIQK